MNGGSSGTQGRRKVTEADLAPPLFESALLEAGYFIRCRRYRPKPDVHTSSLSKGHSGAHSDVDVPSTERQRELGGMVPTGRALHHSPHITSGGGRHLCACVCFRHACIVHMRSPFKRFRPGYLEAYHHERLAQKKPFGNSQDAKALSSARWWVKLVTVDLSRPRCQHQANGWVPDLTWTDPFAVSPLFPVSPLSPKPPKFAQLPIPTLRCSLVESNGATDRKEKCDLVQSHAD